MVCEYICYNGERMKLITSDGVKIHYEIKRTGKLAKKPVLFFVHGLGGDCLAWEKELEYFWKHGYSTVAIDLRGHGLSDDPILPKDYELERMAKDILEIVKKEKIDSYVLIGHCFGGMVSIYAASSNPPGLKSLVLIDTSYRATLLGYDAGTWPRLSKVLEKLAYVFPIEPPRIHDNYEPFVGGMDIDIQRFISDIKSTSTRSYLICCSKLAKYDAESLFKKIKTPTLVVCGNEDSIFPEEISLKLASRIKKAEFMGIVGTNHIIVLSKPKELAEEIEKFI